MPFRKGTIVDLRERMALMALAGVRIGEIARLFEVSRPTVRLWRDRFEAEGRGGLEDRSHATASCPHRTRAEIEALVIAEKKKWSHFGSKKILQRLADEFPDLSLPHRSTVDGILRRHDLVRRRRKRRTPSEVRSPFVQAYQAASPSELSTIDHKGQFRMLNGEYCFPLTMTDHVSRFILSSKALTSTCLEPAWKAVEYVFREHGLPLAMQSDNGPPFGAGNARFSTFSVRLMMLDVQPIFSRPGHPQDNGQHERMHRDMKDWVIAHPAANLAEQQLVLDEFRKMYNEERPHEGLQMQRPSRVFASSSRPFPKRLPKPDYPLHFEKRKVSSCGYVRFRGERFFVGEPFAGRTIAFEQSDEQLWTVQFYRFAIGKVDFATRSFL